MSYDNLVTGVEVFLKCEEVVDFAGKNYYPNVGTQGDPKAWDDSPTLVSGVYATGYLFDTTPTPEGTTSVSIPTGSQDFVMGGWFKSASSDEEQMSIAINWNNGDWDETIGLSTYTRWGGSSSRRGIRAYYTAANDSAYTLKYTNADDASVGDGEWHWYCAESKDDTFSVYFDDTTTPVASGAVTGFAHTGVDAVVNIGSRRYSDFGYEGYMDDVFYHPGQLSSTDKSEIKNKTN
jgi:hypothetical protein